MHRHALTDAQWDLLAEFFPPRPPKRGGQWKDDRVMFDGILWCLNTGAPWRDLPDRFGPRQTGYDRHSAMRAIRLIDRVVARLQRRLNEAGLIDPDLFCIDGTNARAARAAGGAAVKIRTELEAVLNR